MPSAVRALETAKTPLVSPKSSSSNNARDISTESKGAGYNVMGYTAGNELTNSYGD